MFKNSAHRYGVLTRLLHWSIAILIVGLVWLGAYMVDLTYYDRWYNDALSAHRSLGVIAFVLALIMIAWNLYSRPPASVATLKPWERVAAKVMHLTLYAMMMAIPITGYMISTSAGAAVSIFGWFDIPALFAIGEKSREIAIDLHFWLTYGTAGLVLLHALAALKHQYWDRDGTLGRML